MVLTQKNSRDREVHPTRPDSCPVFPDVYADAYRGQDEKRKLDRG